MQHGFSTCGGRLTVIAFIWKVFNRCVDGALKFGSALMFLRVCIVAYSFGGSGIGDYTDMGYALDVRRGGPLVNHE